MVRIEEQNVEKVPRKPRESFLKTAWRYTKREYNIIKDALSDGIKDTVILFGRILVPQSYDRVIRPKSSWFEVKPSKPNGKALLLCHGFAATPEIFHEIAPQLADEGYHVRGIRLSGHGTTVGHLSQTTAADWFASVAWHYKELRKDFDQISFVGHSLGATLGLLLSTIYPIKTLVAMCAPIDLDIPPAKFVREASIFVKYWPRSRRKKEMIKKEGLSTYKASPLFAIGGIFDAGEALRNRADKLNLPVFYIRAMNDHKTLLEQPEEFRKHFPDTPTVFKDAENSPHSLLQGPERDEVTEWIIDWLEDKT